LFERARYILSIFVLVNTIIHISIRKFVNFNHKIKLSILLDTLEIDNRSEKMWCRLWNWESFECEIENQRCGVELAMNHQWCDDESEIRWWRTCGWLRIGDGDGWIGDGDQSELNRRGWIGYGDESELNQEVSFGTSE